MKMMVVGGKRSREYAEHLQSQFSIATSVLAGYSLEDIERMAVLGNIIERVLILEQAWTMDGASPNEHDIRKRINLMTKQARERGSSEQYVFMARSPESALMCFEETYDICDRAAVVLYQQNATVVILHELLATDIMGLRPALVFNPPLTEAEEPYTQVIDVPIDKNDVAETTTTTKRIIKKTRGAVIQRNAGDSPWYATQRIEGGNMNKQTNFKEQTADLFASSNNNPIDRGFADETPYIPASSVDLNTQLQHIFKNTGDPFAAQMELPAAVIPVSPSVPATSDMAAFIRSKAYRNYMLAFAGPGGSGSTFMALNCAARIYSAGFSVAFIDGDLTGHSVQYLTRLGVSGDVLTAEVQARTLRPGFDMYGAGQFKAKDGRTWELPESIKSRYDFIILDIPFAHLQQAVRFLSVSARIAITVESSNWGIGKATFALFNAPVELTPVIRERACLIYNRSDKLSSGLFGMPVVDDVAIKRRVDEIFGAQAALFSAMPVVSIIGSYASAEEYWFSDRLFSDSTEGAALFDRVLQGLLS